MTRRQLVILAALVGMLVGFAAPYVLPHAPYAFPWDTTEGGRWSDVDDSLKILCNEQFGQQWRFMARAQTGWIMTHIILGLPVEEADRIDGSNELWMYTYHYIPLIDNWLFIEARPYMTEDGFRAAEGAYQDVLNEIELP